jgi:hypothetical protein
MLSFTSRRLGADPACLHVDEALGGHLGQSLISGLPIEIASKDAAAG